MIPHRYTTRKADMVGSAGDPPAIPGSPGVVAGDCCTYGELQWAWIDQIVKNVSRSSCAANIKPATAIHYIYQNPQSVNPPIKIQSNPLSLYHGGA